MPEEEKIRYQFISQAEPEDTFTVTEFKGTEGISKLYQFDIIIYADDPDIDLKKVVKNPAKLVIEKDGETHRTFHGILARFEQLQEVSGHVYYRAVLVPRLWLADQYHENQLFLDKKVPDILEEVLKQSGLTSQDYQLKLTGSYRPWEYVCQYNESDFNFISRWMEREGIYYYFEQGEEGEKLILADSSTAHQDIPGGKSVRYSPPDSLTPSSTEQVREFTCHQKLLPKKVILKDYNYRKPSLELKGEADVDGEGRGNVYIYGEHFKTPEEGNALAKIRAEELLCQETVFYGEGTVPPFHTGYIFEMHDHYRDSYNQRYLITELSHEGVQSTYLGGGGSGQASGSEKPAYLNRFTAIKADVQFRPPRLAEKPKIDGALNAKVDAAGSGQYAEIDDEGRYKVILPFDQSGNKDGKASRWIRMAQPYAGDDYGMHFPLHKGTEVLLTFVDGDPDRPIIAGTVPNPETGSPVKGGNQTQNMIRTAGGNQIRIEDSDGGQQIHLSSPTAGSIISLGAPNEGNIFIKTVGDYVKRITGTTNTEQLGPTVRIFGSNYSFDVHGTTKLEYRADVLRRTIGNTNEEFYGTKTTKVIGATDETFVGVKLVKNLSAYIERTAGAKFTGYFAGTKEITVGAKSVTVIGLSNDNIAGLKISTAGGWSITKSGVKNLSEAPINHIKGAAGIKLTCGGSSIEMTPGSIKISSPDVSIKCSKLSVSGISSFARNVTIDKNLDVTGKTHVGWNVDVDGDVTVSGKVEGG